MKVLFICQKEYFRQTVFDAVCDGHHEVFWITSGDPTTIGKALNYAIASTSITHVIFFRPEWLVNWISKIEYIKKNGIKIIGFSTEPIPLNHQNDPHKDQELRLSNLSVVNSVPLDMFIHFDNSSENIIKEKIVHKAYFLPIPVSNRLFNRQTCRKEFDSIFLGRSTEHREDILVLPKSTHNHLHVAHGLVDEYACLFTNKAKVAYNIHNHNYLNFETRPVINLLCGVTTVSERLTRNDLDSIDGFYSFDSKDDFTKLFYSDLIIPNEDQVLELWEKLYSIDRLLELIE